MSIYTVYFTSPISVYKASAAIVCGEFKLLYKYQRFRKSILGYYLIIEIIFQQSNFLSFLY